MNITIQFVLIKSDNQIADERQRKQRGHVVDLYPSDDVCVPAGDYLTLKEPIAMNRPFAYIHVRGYTRSGIAELRKFLHETVDDDGLPIRNRKWLIDTGMMQPETVAILEAKREITVDWNDQNAAILRQLNVQDNADQSSDALGTPAAITDLPTDG